MENSDNLTLHHATNFDYSQRIIKDGYIIGKPVIVTRGVYKLEAGKPVDLAQILTNDTLQRITYLADDPILASACSDHGSGVVFEVKIPFAWVKGHILGPGTYETIDGVEQISLESVTKIMSNNPNETKKALIDSGRLDIMVEEWLLTNLGSNLL